MIDAVPLDTCTLGMIAHPKANPDITTWYAGLLTVGVRVIIPEISDYELRRKFLHRINDMKPSLDRLDELKDTLEYLPIDTETWQLAAKLWADARNRGKGTADPKELDGDAILAAQALRLVEVSGQNDYEVVVATDNVGHLALWVDARPWGQITV
jgi:predicted nucleic acid-binding protein